MGITDYFLIILILMGAGYLFYRSFIKKKGCSSCTVNDCAMKTIVSHNKLKNKIKTI
jgi:hypothetical protein